MERYTEITKHPLPLLAMCPRNPMPDLYISILRTKDSGNWASLEETNMWGIGKPFWWVCQVYHLLIFGHRGFAKSNSQLLMLDLKCSRFHSLTIEKSVSLLPDKCSHRHQRSHHTYLAEMFIPLQVTTLRYICCGNTFAFLIYFTLWIYLSDGLPK